jgi:hypothetical protein|tara:strand:+ start:247 stop:387 length:141 start_codon:yes stop_codon:yes gene_type:complete
MMFDKNSFLRQETKLVIGTLLTIGVGSVFYHFIENWSGLVQNSELY